MAQDDNTNPPAPSQPATTQPIPIRWQLGIGSDQKTVAIQIFGALTTFSFFMPAQDAKRFAEEVKLAAAQTSSGIIIPGASTVKL